MRGTPDEVERLRRFLGLEPGCSAADVEAARRRLSKVHHPDVGGDAHRMQRVNAAADRMLAHLGAAGPAVSPTPPPRNQSSAGRQRHDHPSFTIEALPVEAFEALLIVACQLGDVIDDDPPYGLEVALLEPQRGWCRLDLVPDAGASTVGLAVAAEPGLGTPDLEAVRDAWIEGLNALDWSDLSEGGRLPPS